MSLQRMARGTRANNALHCSRMLRVLGDLWPTRPNCWCNLILAKNWNSLKWVPVKNITLRYMDVLCVMSCHVAYVMPVPMIYRQFIPAFFPLYPWVWLQMFVPHFLDYIPTTQAILTTTDNNLKCFTKYLQQWLILRSHHSDHSELNRIMIFIDLGTIVGLLWNVQMNKTITIVRQA